MLIPVDITKIKPCALDGDSSEIGRSSANVEELREQLIQGNHICVLVSGYRGSGKTTFINQFQKMDDNGKHKLIYANLNLVKEEPYAILLRKLIRSLYAGINEEMSDDISMKNHELAGKIKDAYKRTFYDISETSAVVQKIQNKESIQFSLKVKINGYLMIAILFLVLSFLPFIWPLQAVYTVSLWILSFVSFYTVWKLEKEITNVTSSSDEVLVNRIYDEEIAEKDLKEILKGLNESEYKVIFILDELDKIEQEEELEHIISTMKSLMLSGFASFIFIAGQNLYYKLMNSKIKDDPVISSIFSKHVHISSWTYQNFKDLFESIYDKKERRNLNIELDENNLIQNYVKSTILSSNKIPRTFLNMITQEMIYYDEKFQIDINTKDNWFYETDAQIFDIIEDIIEDSIIDKYDEGIQDFLSYQLFVWIKKMKYYEDNDMITEEIIDVSEIKTKYPKWCNPIMINLCSILLSKMTEIQLLDRRTEDQKTVYKWSETAVIKKAKEKNKTDINLFFINIKDIVALITDMFRDFMNSDEKQDDFKEYNIDEMFEIIDKQLEFNSLYKKNMLGYLSLYRQSNNSRLMRSKDILVMESLNKKKVAVVHDLLVEYVREIITQTIFSDYSLEEQVDFFDFVIKLKDNTNVYFEIKYRRNAIRESEMSKILIQLRNRNLSNNKRNKLMLVIFSDKPKTGIGTKNRMIKLHKELEMKDVYMDDIEVYESTPEKIFDRFALIKQIEDLIER